MKKLLTLCLAICFLLALWGCNDTPQSSTARHEYNKYDPDKNLFLQFLHDEISICVNEDGKQKNLYFSEHTYDADVLKSMDDSEKRFYIVDMDGDGKPEFCYVYSASTYIVRYNEEKECFEQWWSGSSKQLPLGDGQMWDHTSLASAFVDTHLFYDENANLIKSISYRVGVRASDTNYYQIDGSDVTESEWRAESARLYELIENATKPLSYKELFDA